MNTELNLEQVFSKISQQRVLVIGDIILDHYIWGDASRISPEAPVPVVNVNRDTYVVGAAANVAVNITALGAQSELCGVIGQDETGTLLKKLLNERKVATETIVENEDANTIVKTRVVVRNQQLCRLDREGPPQEYGIDCNPFLEKIDKKLAEVDALIVSDYAKGVIHENLLGELLKLAKKHKVFTAYDPKPRRKIQFRGVDLMTPNKGESLELAGIQLEAHEPFPKDVVCSKIFEKYGPKRLIITLGGDGMLLSENGKIIGLVPARAREVFDVSGAGDTSIVALTLALSAGISMESAAYFANFAAGVVVGKVGTATATQEEIREYVERYE